MNELEEKREEIRAVDEQMARLFEQRMRLSEDVAGYKVRSGLPIFDASQEAKVIAGRSSLISDPVLRDYYTLFLRKTMDLSKAYQGRLMKGMKVAYSGVPGAFAQIAASRVFPDADFISCPDFESAYKACEDGMADVAILPIENSYAGDVGAVMDLSFSGNLYINMMLEMDVTQNLLGNHGAHESDIRTVVSHPQALEQCAAFIRSHGLTEKEFANTALAAQYVSQMNDPSVGAIASAETAKLYGLEVITPDINASSQNTTRFATFSRTINVSTGMQDEHFILVFTVRNEAGALAKTLNIIGSHGFNMNNLHSRPLKGPLWNHYFFAELEGSVNSDDGEDLLRQMSTVCDNMKLLGSYKRVGV